MNITAEFVRSPIGPWFQRSEIDRRTGRITTEFLDPQIRWRTIEDTYPPSALRVLCYSNELKDPTDTAVQQSYMNLLKDRRAVYFSNSPKDSSQIICFGEADAGRLQIHFGYANTLPIEDLAFVVLRYLHGRFVSGDFQAETYPPKNEQLSWTQSLPLYLSYVRSAEPQDIEREAKTAEDFFSDFARDYAIDENPLLIQRIKEQAIRFIEYATDKLSARDSDFDKELLVGINRHLLIASRILRGLVARYGYSIEETLTYFKPERLTFDSYFNQEVDLWLNHAVVKPKTSICTQKLALKDVTRERFKWSEYSTEDIGKPKRIWQKGQKQFGTEIVIQDHAFTIDQSTNGFLMATCRANTDNLCWQVSWPRRIPQAEIVATYQNPEADFRPVKDLLQMDFIRKE